LERFLGEIAALEEKLGPVLVQLPPRLGFERATVEQFFTDLRARFAGAVVCEPRHKTWFAADAERLLEKLRIGRVAADPPRAEADGRPGGDRSTVYYRLHGSPKIYYSAYSEGALDRIAGQLAHDLSGAEQAWCVFDNTAEGAATIDALALAQRLAADHLSATSPRQGD
jgi:uncharacterized protein YecE (DUF72 family)